MRKITWLGLEIRELSITDILWLVAFLIVAYIPKFFHDYKSIATVEASAAALTGCIICSPFGLRFKCVYFSIAWLAISCLLLLEHTTAVAYFPVCIFVIYHVFRFVFWRIYQREFIPLSFTRDSVGSSAKLKSYYSKVEQTRSKIEDKRTMQLLIITSISLLFALLYIASSNRPKIM